MLGDRVRAALSRVDGVMPGGAVFGGIEGFWIDATLVAELIDSRSLQIRLTKPLIREHRAALEADARVTHRKTSDWVTVRFATAKDIEFVVELMTLAAPIYRPPPGTTSRPPPTGAALERRRRWH